METTITSNSLANDVAATAQSSQKLSQDFDDFLKLLTTQMTNQDPLSPVESTEFTNQLVGFSQVEQQINQNEKLEQLLSLQLSSMSTVALDYVGMDVSYLGNSAHFNGEDPVAVRYTIDDGAVEAKLHIYNDKQELIKTIDVDATGDNDAVWDGTNKHGEKLEAGNFTFEVDALDSDGNGVNADTAVPGKVVGIEAQNGLVQLVLEGDYLIQIGSVITARES
jgi:flagellar basal-body rod modification protein FlgD